MGTQAARNPVTTIRFPATLAAQARRQAATDGKTVSAWIRRLINQEIARRDGTCPACGHTKDTP